MSVGDWNDASGFGTDCAGDGHCCFSKLANCTNVSGSDIVRVTDVACCTGSASVFEHCSIGIGSWSGSLILSRHSGAICPVCSHSSSHFTTSSHPEQLIMCRPSLRLQALQQNPWSRGPPWCWWVQPERLHFCLEYFRPLRTLFDDMEWSYLFECLTWAQTATCSHMYVNIPTSIKNCNLCRPNIAKDNVITSIHVCAHVRFLLWPQHLNFFFFWAMQPYMVIHTHGCIDKAVSPFHSLLSSKYLTLGLIFYIAILPQHLNYLEAFMQSKHASLHLCFLDHKK